DIRGLDTGRAGLPPDDAGLIPAAALAWDDAGRIRYAGPAADPPPEYRAAGRLDAGGALVIPGLVDCHTHLAFAGWRADEFAERCRGTTYADIAARGGGILRTVALTRAASEDNLLACARRFLHEMVRVGITTVEAKSGYGLSLDDELKQ